MDWQDAALRNRLLVEDSDIESITVNCKPVQDDSELLRVLQQITGMRPPIGDVKGRFEHAERTAMRRGQQAAGFNWLTCGPFIDLHDSGKCAKVHLKSDVHTHTALNTRFYRDTGIVTVQFRIPAASELKCLTVAFATPQLEFKFERYDGLTISSPWYGIGFGRKEVGTGYRSGAPQSPLSDDGRQATPGADKADKKHVEQAQWSCAVMDEATLPVQTVDDGTVCVEVPA